jgi:hypothetical protein
LERALYERQRPGTAEELDHNQKQRVIAMVCSSPPEGRARWTVRLVADLDEDYIAKMEDVLETYEQPYDP